MFADKRILGVTGGKINLMPTQSSSRAIASSQVRKYMDPNQGSPAQQVTAALGGAGIGSNASALQVNSFWASNYQYYMTGLMPADPHLIDTSTLALFYRDIYLFDNVAGSIVDISSHFPFSDWELRGLPKNELKPFEEALAQLNLRQMMPLISTAFLTDGFFCGSLIFNPKTKKFLDTLIHDALSCAVIPSPFFRQDPTINVRVGQNTQQFMHDTSAYAKRYLQSMPRQFIELLKSGAFTLDPLTTLFVPRRSTTDRAYTSYLHRILPMYMIEKTMFRGTLVEAQRRQRAMTHITAGDDQWTPTGEELGALVDEFMKAEYDPLGGWVSTRSAVQAVDLRPGGDFWKWTDMADILVAYKLRALGVSEAYLSGDAAFAAAESAYSTFLETQNSYRGDLTDRVFNTKLFPLIAVINGLYKNPAKRAREGKLVDYLFDTTNVQNLKMPQLHWHKELEAKGEENMLEMLEHASEKGVPIPLKMWMAAAKIDPDALDRDLQEDQALRAKYAQYTGKDTSHEGEDEGSDEFDDDNDDRGSVSREDVRSRVSTGVTSQSLRHLIANPRKGLAGREFQGTGDTFTLSKTGKVKHVPSAVAAERRIRSNDQILKIARKAEKDPHYRESLRRRNVEKLGTDKIKGLS